MPSFFSSRSCAAIMNVPAFDPKSGQPPPFTESILGLGLACLCIAVFAVLEPGARRIVVSIWARVAGAAENRYGAVVAGIDLRDRAGSDCEHAVFRANPPPRPKYR